MKKNGLKRMLVLSSWHMGMLVPFGWHPSKRSASFYQEINLFLELCVRPAEKGCLDNVTNDFVVRVLHQVIQTFSMAFLELPKVLIDKSVISSSNHMSNIVFFRK